MKRAGDRSGGYDVGYGKPPAQNRFVKGKSGNPNGRPKKRAPANDQSSTSAGFAHQPANQMLIEEAYRPVTIREGDKVILLPAIQAVFRAMGVSAMKGNRFAQRTIAELVQQVEAADHKSREEYVKALIDYKAEWEQAIEEARRRGWPEPQPLPHPDDIIVNLEAGTARVCGPRTDVEKRRWDQLLECRDEAQEEVTMYAKACRKARKPEDKAYYLRSWHVSQRRFDRLNALLPRRYRKNLTDRSWEDGASSPGDYKGIDWKDE